MEKIESAGDGHYLYLQTQFGEDQCTQFRVIVVTNPQTHRQDRLQYTVSQLVCSVTRMTLSRAHTSANAVDVAKLLALNKCLITHPPTRSIAVTVTYLKPTTMWSGYPSKSIVFPWHLCHLSYKFCENQSSSFWTILLTNKQMNKQMLKKA